MTIFRPVDPIGFGCDGPDLSRGLRSLDAALAGVDPAGLRAHSVRSPDLSTERRAGRLTARKTHRQRQHVPSGKRPTGAVPDHSSHSTASSVPSA